MTDDEDPDKLREIDLTAWEVPAPRADLADAVVARMHEPDAVSPVTSMMAVPPRRRWWLVAGVAAAAAAVVVLGTIVITGSRRDVGPHDGDIVNGSHVVVAQHAKHVELHGVAADLDPDSELRWQHTDNTIRVEQTRGLVTWKVDDANHLVIDPGAMGASIDATGASLRVEVHMNHADSRVLVGSAITAAVAAMVTVVVYEGHVNVRNAGQTIAVAPGATVEIKPSEPPREPALVGVGPTHVDDIDITRKCLVQRMAHDFEGMRVCAREYRKFHPDDAQTADRLDRDVAEGLAAKVTLVQVKTLVLQRKWAEARKLADATSLDSMFHLEFELALAGTPCGVADLVSSARRDMANGWYGYALVKLETTMTCQPSPDTDKLALTAACSVRGEIHAGAYLATRARHESTTIDALCGQVTIEGPKTTEPPCSDELRHRAGSYARQGDHGAALDMFERVYACKQDRDSARLAYAAACKVPNLTKAREYRDLADPERTGDADVCDPSGVASSRTAKMSCDADDLKNQGTSQFTRGNFTAALKAFEDALACKPSTDLVKLAYTAACNAHDAAKARLYFSRVSPAVQRDIAVICVRNRIDLASETASSSPPACDANELKDKATALFSMGQFAPALVSFERAMDCATTPRLKLDLLKLSFVAACNARNERESKRLYGKLSPALQRDLQVVCVRNMIQVP